MNQLPIALEPSDWHKLENSMPCEIAKKISLADTHEKEVLAWDDFGTWAISNFKTVLNLK